ncbi:hypothetical protein K1719_033577 [Acacia pycnantha]|nr:hypothetical protein K1719_033577 [Acacia pycnantha]
MANPLGMELSRIFPVQTPITTEEDDLLQRSSKKINNGGASIVEEEWPRLGKESQKIWINGQSFAEKLKGTHKDDSMGGSPDEDNILSDDTISENDAENEDSDPFCPRPCMVILAKTKCENESRLLRLKKLGFDGLCSVPSIGRSGGIVVVRQSDIMGVSVLRNDRQFIHFLCSKFGEPSFFLTVVYSLPLTHHKQELWQNLHSLSLIISDPWLIIGDFNDIGHSSKRIGGSRLNVHRMEAFLDRISSCQLSDLGSSGPKFTWCGPCSTNASRLFERLVEHLSIQLS